MGFGLDDLLPIGGGVVGGIFGGPMGAGVGMAAGSTLNSLFNSPSPPGAVTPYQVDPALYDTAKMQGLADLYGGRSYNMQDTPRTDYAMANEDRRLSLMARGQQQGLADELQAVLRGERSSLAQQQLVEGQARAANLSENLAANARGGAGAQILASQNAMRQGAASALETNRMAGLMRAGEEATAREQLGGLLAGMRGQDLGMRGQSQGQAQFLTQTEMAQRAQNNQQAQYFSDLQLRAQQGVSQTQQAQAAAQQGAAQSVQAINAQREQAAYQAQQQKNQGYYNAGGSLMQLGMQGGGPAKPSGGGLPDPYGINSPGF